MADRLAELQSAVQELAGSVRRLEARVLELERRGPGPNGLARHAAAVAEAPSPEIALSQGTLALFGRALLVLAGAYVARALTDGRVVPPGVGVALGLAYAVFFQFRADRAARGGRRESAVFHAVASCVIAFPLLWETTARFGLLGPRPACAALVAFFALGLGVAWRQGLAVAAGAATGLALATAVALFMATRDLLAVFLALVAIAAGLEWLAYRERWLALRWWAAVVLDAVAFLLAALVVRPHGLPPGYVPLAAPVAGWALLALPALYVAGLAARTLRRGRPVTLFEVTQGTVAVLLGFGGAWKILAARGDSPLALGVLALLLGALCYGAAFAFAERRPGQGRNFYFYSTAGGLLMLGGTLELGLRTGLTLVWTGLGLTAVGLGRRFGRTTLRAHGAIYLLAAAFGAGLTSAGVRALAGLPPRELPALAWAVAVGAALAWGVLAGERAAAKPAGARLPRLLLALVAVLSLAEAARGALAATLGPRLALDAGAEAVARSAVLVALVLGLAWLARGQPELVWLVYALVAAGAVKLLLHDVRAGRPATLVASLGLYGSLLILLPRLAKPRERSG